MFTVKLSKSQHPNSPSLTETLIVEAREVEIRWNRGQHPGGNSHQIVVRPGQDGNEEHFYHVGIGGPDEFYEGIIENAAGKTTSIVRADTYMIGQSPRAA